MKIPLKKGKYIAGIDVNDDHIEVRFKRKQKIALLFVSLGSNYWPYVEQAIDDCKKLFMPQHDVDYFLWSDIPKKDDHEALAGVLNALPTQEQIDQDIKAGLGMRCFPREMVHASVARLWQQESVNIIETGAIEWPAPTLMRYHLFLHEEERLKQYDHIFYMDADMRVVQKISDEILSEELTCAPHPGYAIAPRYVPPLEPNPESAAFIPRLGQYIKEENGNVRFMPFYAAGGFQGGTSKAFIKAMKVMRSGIDADFNKNYTAIWNDETHWNKYLWDFQKKKGKITFLDVSYVYPDSLIKEYYEPMWGRSYPPKIITITKPFTLSKQGGAALNKMLGNQTGSFECPTCRDILYQEGHTIQRIIQCQGQGKPHEIEMQKI